MCAHYSQGLTEIVGRFTIGDCGLGCTDPAICLNVRHHACRRTNGLPATSEESFPGLSSGYVVSPSSSWAPPPGRLLTHMVHGTRRCQAYAGMPPSCLRGAAGTKQTGPAESRRGRPVTSRRTRRRQAMPSIPQRSHRHMSITSVRLRHLLTGTDLNANAQ